MDRKTDQSTKRGRGWYWLLLIPFVAILWVPFYNSAEPRLAGFPFFYWYQLLWVIGCGVITGFVYLVTGRDN